MKTQIYKIASTLVLAGLTFFSVTALTSCEKEEMDDVNTGNNVIADNNSKEEFIQVLPSDWQKTTTGHQAELKSQLIESQSYYTSIKLYQMSSTHEGSMEKWIEVPNSNIIFEIVNGKITVKSCALDCTSKIMNFRVEMKFGTPPIDKQFDEKLKESNLIKKEDMIENSKVDDEPRSTL